MKMYVHCIHEDQMAVCTVVAPVGHTHTVISSQIHTSAGGMEDLQDSLLHVTQHLLSSASSQSNEQC